MGRSYTLLQSLAGTHSELQSFIRLKDPDEMEKALSELQRHQEEARELIAAGGAVAASLIQKYDTLRSAQKTVIEEVLRGNVADAYDKFFSSVGTQYESLLADLGRQNEEVRKASKDLLASHSTRSQRSMFWQTVTVAIVLAGLIVFGWRLKLRIVRELGRVSGVIDESSTQLACAIGQISASSQLLAEGASEQAASLEETSASLEEMSSMTKRNAENAQPIKAPPTCRP
jgi:methyl-accepting chemotaxis protein